MTEKQWGHAQLPIHKGGLGLRSARDTSNQAFLASVRSSRPLVEALLGGAVSADKREQAALEECGVYAGQELRTKLDDDQAMVTQRELTEQYDHKHWDFHWERATPEAKTRLKAFGAPWADGWLGATPSHGFDTLLSNSCLSSSLKFRLGVEFVSRDGVCPLLTLEPKMSLHI